MQDDGNTVLEALKTYEGTFTQRTTFVRFKSSCHMIANEWLHIMKKIIEWIIGVAILRQYATVKGKLFDLWWQERENHALLDDKEGNHWNLHEQELLAIQSLYSFTFLYLTLSTGLPCVECTLQLREEQILCRFIDYTTLVFQHIILSIVRLL